MIYTIGSRKNYIKTIKQWGLKNFQKLGKQEKSKDYPEGYAGGYAFKTFEDAQTRIDEAYKDRGFCVFGLLADWENDTDPNGNYWHNLLFTRNIVLVDESGKQVSLLEWETAKNE